MLWIDVTTMLTPHHSGTLEIPGENAPLWSVVPL